MRPSSLDNWSYGHSQWAEFFHENRYADPDGYVSFPSLESLVLDFSAWNLGPHHGLAVSLSQLPEFEFRFTEIIRLDPSWKSFVE